MKKLFLAFLFFNFIFAISFSEENWTKLKKNVFIDYALYTSILKMDVFSKEVFLINLKQEVNLYLETLFNYSIADCTKKIGVNKNNEVLIIYQVRFKDTDIVIDTVEKVINFYNQKNSAFGRVFI